MSTTMKVHTGKRLAAKVDNRLYTVRDAKALALAGSSALSLWSAKTNRVLRYEVKAVADGAKRYFVNLVDGERLRYLGVVEATGFRLTSKSKLPADASEVRAFHYFWSHIMAGKMAPRLVARNDSTTGRCACCGRKLTDRASKGRGVGAACVENILKAW